jgi:DNA-binding MarR family transcriptional regulator
MLNVRIVKRDVRRLLDHLAELGRLNTLRDPVSRLADHDVDLTPPQLHAVLWLAKDGPLAMATLAQRVGCSGPTTTGVVDRLENIGLVERQPKPGDRRVVLVAPTELCRQTAAVIEEEIGTQVDGVLGLLGNDDRRDLIDLIGRLASALRTAHEAGADEA